MVVQHLQNNVLFEQRNMKLWNKQHFIENKTGIQQYVLKNE